MGTVVLGAGLAYANHSGERCEIYEKEDHAGGLCSSFQIGGFTFDSAVHLSFTDYAEVRKVFDQAEYLTHRPLAYNFYEGKYVKHPMIYNLSKFSTEDKCRYIESFLERETGGRIENYGDWLAASYGREMAGDFYGKYTRKYWTVAPEEMSTSWIGSRLQSSDLHKILSGSYDEQSGENSYAKEMRYPKRGGIARF